MSARLTPLHPTKIEKKLRKLGFKLDDVTGSCRFFVREKSGALYVVQVHFHPEEKGIEIIKNILRTGGITREEWINS